MDILEQMGITIVKNDSMFINIEEYENDPLKTNIYYADLENDEKNFLIEIKNEKLIPENFKNLCEIKALGKPTILHFLRIFQRSDDRFFLCFEYSDIKLSDYINCANPSLKKRMHIMKQFVETVVHFHNHRIPLDEIAFDYIFIQGLEDPALKVLYTDGLLENPSANKSGMTEEEISFPLNHEFYWLSSIIFVIFKFNPPNESMTKNNSNFINWNNNFEILFSQLEDDCKSDFQNLIVKSFQKIKKIESKEYNLKKYVEDFNKILIQFGYSPISEDVIIFHEESVNEHSDDKARTQKICSKAETLEVKVANSGSSSANTKKEAGVSSGSNLKIKIEKVPDLSSSGKIKDENIAMMNRNPGLFVPNSMNPIYKGAPSANMSQNNSVNMSSMNMNIGGNIGIAPNLDFIRNKNPDQSMFHPNCNTTFQNPYDFPYANLEYSELIKNLSQRPQCMNNMNNPMLNTNIGNYTDLSSLLNSMNNPGMNMNTPFQNANFAQNSNLNDYNYLMLMKNLMNRPQNVINTTNNTIDQNAILNSLLMNIFFNRMRGNMCVPPGTGNDNLRILNKLNELASLSLDKKNDNGINIGNIGGGLFNVGAPATPSMQMGNLFGPSQGMMNQYMSNPLMNNLSNSSQNLAAMLNNLSNYNNLNYINIGIVNNEGHQDQNLNVNVNPPLNTNHNQNISKNLTNANLNPNQLPVQSSAPGTNEVIVNKTTIPDTTVNTKEFISKKRERAKEEGLASSETHNVKEGGSTIPKIKFQVQTMTSNSSSSNNNRISNQENTTTPTPYMSLDKKKSEFFKVEVEKYKEFFEKDMAQLGGKGFDFMKHNFPTMFTIENFYLHYKLNKIRRETNLKSKLVVEPSKLSQKDSHVIKEEVQPIVNKEEQEGSFEIIIKDRLKVWNPTVIPEIKLSKEYFSQIEKTWPFEQFPWSEERALEFLQSNQFDIEKCRNLIAMKDKSFQNFMTNKLIIDEIMNSKKSLNAK